MSDVTKLYWDASCFLSVLNGEKGRSDVCADVLRNAELGNVRIFTSVWTVVEVVRPKKPGTAPMPEWANAAITSIEKDYPHAQQELEMLWRRHQSDEALPKLTRPEIEKIEAMFFGWTFLTLVRIDKAIATHAVALQRDYNLKAGDAIHVASAIASGVSELQKWDRDFDKVKNLVNVTEPSFITAEGPLITKMVEDTKPVSSLPADLMPLEVDGHSESSSSVPLLTAGQAPETD
jgi:predicted nucleic acid-binding protein